MKRGQVREGGFCSRSPKRGQPASRQGAADQDVRDLIVTYESGEHPATGTPV